jgi:hypothetical protein
VVTALDGSAFDPDAGSVVASNGRLHQEIIDILLAP